MKIIKVLVTGGAGFIGSHLVNRILKEKKYKVLVVDNLKKKGGLPFFHSEAKFYKGDILKKKTLNVIKKWKPKIIFHLAAQSAGESSYENPLEDYTINGYGTFLLAKLAREINCKKFIYTSSVAIYGSNKKTLTENSNIQPDSLYGISKYAGEMFLNQLLKNSQTRTYIFRLFNTFGPGENLLNLKKGMVSIYSNYVWKKKPIIVKGSLKRFRNFVYVEDCVKVLFSSINNKKLNKFEIINLSSGKKVYIKNLIKIITKVNNFSNYKVISQPGTPGDSFGTHSSNRYLLKKFPNLKFSFLDVSIKKYFEWINILPAKKSLEKFHPLNLV